MLLRNSCYCIGILAERGGLTFVNTYKTTILTSLNTVLGYEIKVDTKDNVIAAVARLIYTAPDSLPLESIIDTWLSNQPLLGDKEEGNTVARALVTLLERQPTLIKSERFVELLLDCVLRYSMDEEVAVGVRNSINFVKEWEEFAVVGLRLTNE